MFDESWIYQKVFVQLGENLCGLLAIFDIEMMFLIPWCASVSKLDLLGFWSMIDFLIELGIGFFYIWYVKALDWD
jgi:NADH-quinone oxidoreductase subunit A